MKKGKDLIRFRLKCFINGDITLAQTIEDFNHDVQEASISHFLKGFVIGSAIAVCVINYVISK
jgi:hypothetical protein